MNSGLEIFASPPGKKMQILSLLSGGERTLTALALLFAVFQTNPSPICVLDEAEAALDESNIGRFCSLVEDIAKETGTRFLIITHQRLTMARMDRLYGVTMGEKGVSQLVSVDLAGAVAIRDGEHVDNIEKAAAALEDVRAA
jgi:chromosome segregation protein